MRLIMVGTGPFGVPTFRGLFETNHTVVALVTAPIRRRRGKPMSPVSSIRDVAHEHGVPILDPEDVNTSDSQLNLCEYKADLSIVCDYGQILSADVLAATRWGGVNLHGSLLPKYRGAAPINWAIYHGDLETGVTVIHMTPQVDAGPCIAQANIEIDPDETAVELENRLSEMGAWLMRRAIDSIQEGRLEALPQDASAACNARRLKKSDGVIDWSRSAVAIKNQVRAFEPWPKTFTYWHRPPGRPVRLILGPIAVVDSLDADVTPGAVVRCDGGKLVVATGRQAVRIESVQPAGKRMLSAEEFLRGYHVQPGERFGPE
ncbi:MAG: methionyl-tRNA formyltransferase [Candidatus Nealsonbacteria bacterium]|nr:methionyl-tRNA formyltransferase [Candidatus Nealsonbacteria bacterium]